MGTRIVQGFCTRLEVEADTRTTEVSFVFPTPQDPVKFGALMTRLASGIEVLIDSDDDDDD
jgi:hypothetical protein